MDMDLRIVDIEGARKTVITEENKDELKIIHFPNIRITFDDIFEEIE